MTPWRTETHVWHFDPPEPPKRRVWWRRLMDYILRRKPRRKMTLEDIQRLREIQIQRLGIEDKEQP